MTFFSTLCNKGLKSSFFGVNYISIVYKHISSSLNHNLSPVYVSPSANNSLSLINTQLYNLMTQLHQLNQNNNISSKCELKKSAYNSLISIPISKSTIYCYNSIISLKRQTYT